MLFLLPSIPLIMAAAAGAQAQSFTLVSFGEPPARQVERESIERARTTFVEAPADDLLAWIINVPLEEVFNRYGTIPAVAGTRPMSPDWPDAGAGRQVLLSDGHQAAEVLLAVDGPGSFTYQVWGFTNAAGNLADYAIGQFEVRPVDGGSELTWTYTFAPRSSWTRIPLSFFVATQWSGYMTRALNNLAEGAEQAFALSSQARIADHSMRAFNGSGDDS